MQRRDARSKRLRVARAVRRRDRRCGRRILGRWCTRARPWRPWSIARRCESSAEAPRWTSTSSPRGTPVHIAALATNRELRGTIARRSPAADPSTRTVHLELDVPDADRTIPVGTTGEIASRSASPSPRPKSHSPQPRCAARKATVFVVEGNMAQQRRLSREGRAGGRALPRSSLRPGRARRHRGARAAQRGRPSRGAARAAPAGSPPVDAAHGEQSRDRPLPQQSDRDPDALHRARRVRRRRHAADERRHVPRARPRPCWSWAP